jgi:dTDP-4-amino-4,6-dideoxygalactose transaminase
MSVINVFQPSLGERELAAVSDVFRSNWLGKGSQTDLFEANFAHYLGVDRERVTSVSCCTEGLFQSISVLGIGPGDEVVLPTISFVGAGNAICAVGANPVFCDVDPRTLNVTLETIKAALTHRTRAVIVIHYGGYPCEIELISNYLKECGIYLIEDSACSVASRHNGRACGTFGDIGIWSFDAMKILVTGDGAMVFFKNPDHKRQCEQNIYLGLSSKDGFSNSLDNKWWEFEVSSFGRRAIINDLSSAIGLVQLQRLADFILLRQNIHDKYNEILSEHSDWLTLPPELQDNCSSSYYFYWVQTKEESVRNKLSLYLRSQSIYTTFRYYPLHWVQRYESKVSLPQAEHAARTTLCLPIHQALSDSDLDRIFASLSNFAKTAL